MHKTTHKHCVKFQEVLLFPAMKPEDKTATENLATNPGANPPKNSQQRVTIETMLFIDDKHHRHHVIRVEGHEILYTLAVQERPPF